MTFAHPYFCFCFYCCLCWLAQGQKGKPPAFVYSSVQLVRGILNVTQARSGGFLSALRWFTLACLLSRWLNRVSRKSETKISASGVDIVSPSTCPAA
jgi:hypothetical protein